METRNKKIAATLPILVVLLSLILVVLLICMVVMMKNQDDADTTAQQTSASTNGTSDGNHSEPESTEPGTSAPAETQPTESQPTETQPTEPDSPSTEPPETQPTTTKPTIKPEPEPEPDPSDPLAAAKATISAFAAQHGLTLADYPEKLIDLLARKPETADFVLNYPLEYGKEHAIDISGYADYEGVPLFIQWDKQWGYIDYTGNIAGLAACGPTCMSMIMYHFTRDPQYTPAYMMKFAESNSAYAVKGYGTQWAFFKLGGKELGLNVKELNSDQIASEKAIAKVLESGRIIVMNVRPGVFTTIGHYLLVVGYEDGKFRVNDPNSRINSEKLWEFEEFSDQIKMMWSFSL